ncbi:MAG: OsmC family protein [Candidatus Dormibacteraeota bacterium]|nr:OsmC family protein [Candidatus Dormibacteraeota bacterium]
MAESTVVTTRWAGSGVRFEASGPRGQRVIVDEPKPLGEDAGMDPAELLLGALSACSGISALSLLQKMRQPVRTLEIRAHGQRQDDWPKAFTAIQLEFLVGGDGPFDRALVEKAVNLAHSRYCPVSGTIQLGQNGCRIDASVSIRRGTL